LHLVGILFPHITYVVVYLSTGKLNLKVKLHVLIEQGEKRGPKLISFLYCVCNYAALGYLYIYIFVIFSYFDLWCETYKLVNWNELHYRAMYCGLVQKGNTNICHEKYMKLREFIFKVEYLLWNTFFNYFLILKMYLIFMYIVGRV